MCSILGQVSSCLNFIILDVDEGEDDIEDEDLIMKIIMNHTNQVDEVPKVYHQYYLLVYILRRYKLNLMFQFNKPYKLFTELIIFFAFKFIF